MYKLTEKLKDRLQRHQQQPTILSTIRKPTTEEVIYRFRKQRGVNLGSWFVLEPWISDVPFRSAHAPGQSDLDVARGANARLTLETHWDTWIKVEDWAWLVEKGINTVRVPIGYYHLCGADPSVLTNTVFHDFEYVFTGAWARITRAIETASQHGIGVLLDLHAAPGKQNNDAHAGTSEPPTFFSSKQHRQHTLHVLRVLLLSLISHSPPLPNVIGIELLNEPSPPSASSHTILKEWYASAIKELNALDPNMPLYIGDCWCTDEYAEFIESLPGTGQEDGSFVVLDHHLYRCFTDSDIHTSAESHAQALSNPGAPTHQTFARVTEKIGRARRGGGLVIGEWSGALNPGSMTGDHGEWRRYIEAQLGLYEMTCAGWFFWTFRKQGEGDAGWSFRDAVRGGEFPQFVGLRVKQQYSSAQINGEQERERRERVRDEERDKVLAAHTSYWSQYPGKYAHWRFGEGFMRGWEDAWMFFVSEKPKTGRQANELGFTGAWARRTTKDWGEGYWEYEHGFMQAIDAAKRIFRASFCS